MNQSGPGHPSSGTRQRQDPPAGRETNTISVRSLQQIYQHQGLTAEAITVMLQAKRSSTHKQYSTYITAWYEYCHTHNINPFYPTAAKEMWDPATLLDALKHWSPAQKIDLKKLTIKLITLILLVSGQRIQTLPLLHLGNMTVSKSSFRFRLVGLLKQSRPGYANPDISLTAYAPDRRICVYTYLQEYLERTKLLRCQESQLILTYKKPHRKASKATMACWVQQALHVAGIDISVYGPHSIRSASTSAAQREGATMDDILKTAGWTNTNTFATYYKKPLCKDSNYAASVLQ